MATMNGNRTAVSLMAAVVLALSIPAQAQQTLPDSLRFTIRKEYRPVARDAKRIVPTPEVPTLKTELPKMEYSVLPVRQELNYETQPLNAAQLANEPLTKLRSGHLKVGFGNYTMPFFEASFGSLRSKSYQAGGFARYHSSFATLEGLPFGFTDAGVDLYGKKYLKSHILGSTITYDHDGNFFYGYNPEDTAFTTSDIRQSFHHFGITLDLTAIQDGKKLRHINRAGIGYGYTTDHYSSTEHHAKADVELVFNIKKEKLFGRVTGDYWRNDMPTQTLNNGVIGFEPEFRAERKRWGIGLGVNLSLDINDTTTKVLVFPVLDFHYYLVQDLFRFYAGATGGVNRNGLRTNSQMNPFALTDLTLSNSWERLNVYGGFKGKIFRGLSYDLSVAQIITGQQLFWVNDWTDSVGNRFTPEYHDIMITRLKGELSYHLKEKLQLVAMAEYRFFTMPSDSIKPWHEAPFRFTFGGNYNLKDKFIFKASITAQGDRIAQGFAMDSLGIVSHPEITLKGFADANIGVEYRYKKWLGAFVDFRNIGAIRYELWERYPSQRFSFIAGVHFSF
jgi:hypothetical protein